MATAGPEDDAQNHSSKPFMAASPLLKISHQETQPAITRENPEETCKNSWKKKKTKQETGFCGQGTPACCSHERSEGMSQFC